MSHNLTSTQRHFFLLHGEDGEPNQGAGKGNFFMTLEDGKEGFIGESQLQLGFGGRGEMWSSTPSSVRTSEADPRRWGQWVSSHREVDPFNKIHAEGRPGWAAVPGRGRIWSDTRGGGIFAEPTQQDSGQAGLSGPRREPKDKVYWKRKPRMLTPVELRRESLSVPDLGFWFPPEHGGVRAYLGSQVLQSGL